MILTIYIIILTYFILGGISFHFINKKKSPQKAKENRIKFISYVFIIHILFLGIIFNPVVFQFIGIIIVLTGLFEVIKLFKESNYRNPRFFAVFILFFMILCSGFIFFTFMEKDLILFTFLILSVFDAFSQISGQLFGRKKIFPAISPNKTYEGLAGGIIIAISSSLMINELIGKDQPEALFIASGIILFSFIGDASSSLYKRKYNVKDFSNIIPGHGGIMDRFDSLIAGGTFIALLALMGI